MPRQPLLPRPARSSASPSTSAETPTDAATTGDDASTKDLASVFHAAASTSEDKGSARVTMTMDLGGQGTMTMTGVERWKGSLAADFTANIGVSGQKITMRELIAPDAMYIKMSGAAAKGMPTPWLKMSFKDVSKMSGINLDQLLSQARQSDPSKQLDMLAAAGDISLVGQETVNGVDATHYRGTADVKKLMANAGLDASFVSQLGKSGVSTIKYDLWLNADKLPVKLVEDMTIQGKPTTMTMTMSDYGVPVVVKAPPASQVTDLAKLMGKKA